MNLDAEQAKAVGGELAGWLSTNWSALATAVVVVGTGAVVAGWRRHHRALMDREARVLLPTETFDPTPEEIRRWAAALMGTRRRREWPRRRAEAIRFTLSAEAGLVRQRLCASRRALELLEPAVMHQVELLRPEPEAEGVDGSDALGSEFLGTRNSEPGWASRLTGWRRADWSARRGASRASRYANQDSINPDSGFRTYRARAELRVAPDQTHALAALALNPDPLQPLVAAMAELGDGESAHVVLDLQPLSGRQRSRERTKARKRDKTRPDWVSSLTQGQWLQDDPLAKSPPAATMNPGQKGALARLEARSETMTDYDRFASGEPVFAVQLLVWADAQSRGRSKAIVNALVNGMSPMGQRAAWRRVGLPVGRWYIGGADGSAKRWRFDHRAATGCHRPARPSIVGQAEIAGLIKPPSVHCHAANVERGGGLVPPPPTGLPDWTPAVAGVFPLGEVTERGVKRWVGVSLAETLFTVMFGKAGFGKTNAAQVAMVAIARQPAVPADRGSGLRPGLCFLDPHGDGIDDLKGYLIDQADRVRILDLRRRRGAPQAGWNPLSMVGRNEDEIEDIVSMMVAGFSAVLGWTEVNNRAQNLLSQAVSSLCRLGTQLPPHLQPTLFQVPTILTDDAWRDELLQFLTPHQQDFWTIRLKTQTDAKAATSPVTNLCDRMRASNAMVGLFGQPVSTFDMRAAMDAGDIVLLCPGGAGDKEQMVHVLLLFDIFRSATSRTDILPEDRRPFHVFADEMQVADRGAGSVLIARMLQECRKFALRLHAMLQQPNALTKATLAALSDNRSHLSSATVGSDSAAWLAREFGGAILPATMTRIPRWHRVASVAHNGQVSGPFRIRNLGMTEAFGPPASPESVAAMEAVVDANMARRDVPAVVADLDTLDARILEHLTGRRPSPPTPGAPGPRRRRPPVTSPVNNPAPANSPATSRSGESPEIPPMPDGTRPPVVVSIDRGRTAKPRQPWSPG